MKNKYNLFIFSFILFVCLSSVSFGALTDGLISYWSFDSDATDEIGSNDLTITGGAILGACKLNDCYGFNGGTQYLSDADNPSYDDVKTLSFWYWADATQTGTADAKHMVGKFVSGTNVNGVSHYSGSRGIFVYSTDNTFYYSTGITTDTWHHLVILFNTSQTILYVDATERMRGNPQTTMFDNANDFRIAGASANKWFKGYIDEVGIWNRELTNAEITSDLWNGGAGYHPVIATYPVPVTSNYNYTNDNIINSSLRSIWATNPNNVIEINNNNFSITFNTDIDSNCSAVVDVEMNYSTAINNNSEYKLLTTDTTSHSITALNDSFIEGNHYLCLACISSVGYENISCDVKLNFSLVLPIGSGTNETNITGSNIDTETNALIDIYIKFFILFMWVIFLFLTFTLNGEHNKPIQFINILQLCFGLIGGSMWWGISVLIGFPVVFVALGVFIGLIMKAK